MRLLACVNQVVCCLDYNYISCSTSENILSKVILKYHISMLALPSRISQNPVQNNYNKNNFSQFFIVPEHVLCIFQRHCKSLVTTGYQSEI